MGQKSSSSNEQRHRSGPARVLRHFIAGLVFVLLATLLLGELNLPYYGATVWDLGLAVAINCGHYVVAAAAWAAGHFVFTVGALGVLWLIRIHLHVQRYRQYDAGILDCIFAGLALALIVVYFVYEDQVLPIQASVFDRIALYSAISVMSFGLVVTLGEFDEALSSCGSGWDSLVECTVIGMLVAGIATGQHGAENEAPFFSYRVFNAVLHLVATFGAFAMGSWFRCEVDDQRDALLKADAEASPMHAGAD